MILGKRRGATLIQDVRCSDVCLNNTVHIIRYELSPGATCEQEGGKVETMFVPRGIRLRRQEFCFPAILSAHRSEIVPMLGMGAPEDCAVNSPPRDQ